MKSIEESDTKSRPFGRFESVSVGRAIGGSIIIALVLVSCLFGFSRVYAQKLLTASDIVQGVQSQLLEDQVAHYQTEVALRRDPAYRNPADPYHQNWENRLAQPVVIDNWLTQNTGHSISRWRDDPDIILQETIFTPSQMLMHEATMGIVNQVDISTDFVASPEAVEAEQRSRSTWEKAQINGVEVSSWGGLAWVIHFRTTQASPTDFGPSLMTVVAPTNYSPFASDLEFQETQWVMEVDQQTGWTISRRLLALTQPEPTTLYSETSTKPEIKSIQEISVPLEGRAILQENQKRAQPSVETGPRTYVGADGSLEKLASQLQYSIFAPRDDVLNRIEKAERGLRIYHAPEIRCPLERPLAYNFDLCSGWGETVALDYTFWSQADFSDIQSVKVSLGPSRVVVPLLKQSPPNWLSSSSVPLVVRGQTITGWLVPNLNDDPNVDALMFEMGDTFVQLRGYKTELATLVDMAQGMDMIDPAVSKPTQKIYLPAIGR